MKMKTAPKKHALKFKPNPCQAPTSAKPVRIESACLLCGQKLIFSVPEWTRAFSPYSFSDLCNSCRPRISAAVATEENRARLELDGWLAVRWQRIERPPISTLN